MLSRVLSLAPAAHAGNASAQEDVSAMLNHALRYNGCGMTDLQARAHLDAAGVPWSEVLDAVRDLSESGYIFVAPRGKYIGIDPSSCQPPPIYNPDDSPGPKAADWINERLAQEPECRLPVETLRSEELAAGVDPERLEDVLRDYSAVGRLDDETGEMRLELARCAYLQNPENWDLLAIQNEGSLRIQHAIGGALRIRGCRMPAGDATVRELQAALVEFLELDLAPEGLSPLAATMLETMIRDSIARENRSFAVEPATGDLVASECES